ncbi:hypothetical protein I316_00486 [Kwoniella heveanensis BCC8398]|uniref:GP-PDE domain-containing protein n=1 Tax=Kwoniella heveanensis BCC8398 TaxID=1296120 RepID=A0A1B9H273_9TREE|nr:hypothetical protein I316_00486 [Kwoniella heveanensis BCC8398]
MTYTLPDSQTQATGDVKVASPHKCHAVKRDVRQMIEAIKYPAKDSFLLSAHRGYRWDGVPENSRSSIRRAVAHGMICVEIDIRLTSDKVPVLFHDPSVGRVTNIAEHQGREASDVYSPFTGKGYNPHIIDLPWKGLVENLKLKDEHGEICKEGVLDFASLLDLIETEKLEVVLFMDIKEKAAVPVLYELLKNRTNGSGVPALEWCVWKIFVHFYGMPEELESEAWWQEAIQIGKPVYIPVYEPWPARQLADPLASIKAWSHKPYVLALEIGMRAEGGFMQDLLDYATSPGCPVKSIGFFAALGDLWPWDGKEPKFDIGEFEVPWNLEKQKSHYLFRFDACPKTHNELLIEGDSPDGHDYRHDLARWKELGFTWTITDRGVELRDKGFITE